MVGTEFDRHNFVACFTTHWVKLTLAGGETLGVY